MLLRHLCWVLFYIVFFSLIYVISWTLFQLCLIAPKIRDALKKVGL